MESINNLNKRFKPLFNYKNGLTITVFIAYFSNAINYSLVGPTLTSLASIFGTSIERISLIYTIRSFSYTIGALSGFAFNYLNRQLCLIAFTLIMGITLGSMPVLTPIIVLFIIGGINGLMAGGSDTAINAWIMELWDQNSGPVLNALHFTFGCGSIFAPLIAQRYLTDNERKWNLTIAYLICGAICILSAVLLTFSYFYRKYKLEEQLQPIDVQRTQTINEEIITESQRRELSPKLGLIIVVFGCILLATYTSMEINFFSFQPTFVQFSALNMTESQAAVLSSATAAAFTITRGIGIFVAMRLASDHILFVHFLVIIVFNLVIIFTYDMSLFWTYFSNIGVGIGCSSVYPTIYSFLQQIVEIDNRKASIFLFIGGLTSAIYPLIIGNQITVQPLVLIYFNIISITVCFVVLVAIKFIILNYSNISYNFPQNQSN